MTMMLRTVARHAYTPVRSSFKFVGMSPRLTNRCQLIRNYAITDTTGNNIEDKIDKLTSHEFNHISQEYLDSLNDNLEVLSEEFPQIDCELNQGILTIEVPPLGSYVINKQPPNKQIWLSSPISGPKRYDLIHGKWVTLRDGSKLTEVLQQEISTALNQEITLDLEN